MTLLITGDVNLVHLAKVVFTRFLQSGVIFSVFLMWTVYKVFIDLLQYQFCPSCCTESVQPLSNSQQAFVSKWIR